MRSGYRIAALAAALACCAGCGLHLHRGTPPPVVAQAPSLPPTRMAALIPAMPPLLPAPSLRPVKLDTTTPPEPGTPVVSRPSRPNHHHPRPEVAKEPEKAPPENTTAAPSSNAQVASGQPSEASPIGQLSTANDSTNTADRHAISDLIDSTENGLNAIKRPLSSDEQKTVAQIRTFITHARDALKADDLDGARTLATKAHLLLEELTKQ